MPVVMVTGSRDIQYPGPVHAHLKAVFDMWPSGTTVAVSGGAEGADTLWARAALDVGVPLHVMLPNSYYRTKYSGSIPDDLLARAQTVTYVVNRQGATQWRHLWDQGKWWRDNHARNRQMVVASDHAVVVCQEPPKILMGGPGGTAATLRMLAQIRPEMPVWWIPDGLSMEPRYVTLPDRTGML